MKDDEIIAEFRIRATNAIGSLTSLADNHRERDKVSADRYKHKAQGVKLALSYIEEMIKS